MKITLLLVDDHQMVREGIRSFFSANRKFEVIGEAANGVEAVEAACSLRPDIVLMDIQMPVMNGLDATVEIRQKAPGVKIVIVTVVDSGEYVAQIAKVGAHGYVLKDASPTQLIEAILTVHSGKRYFAPQIAGQLADLVQASDSPKELPLIQTLSPREKEILILIAEGLFNKEIASKLSLSTPSVKTYRRRLMEKLNIHHTAGLTKFAMENGLLP